MAEKEPYQVLVGRFVRRLNKNNSDWSAMSVIVDTPEGLSLLPQGIQISGGIAYVKVTGTNLQQIQSVYIRYYGRWKHDNKYGWQFQAALCELLTPSTREAAKALLSSSTFPNVGAKTADAVLKTFGNDTFDIITNDPDRLMTVPGMRADRAASLVNNWRKVTGYLRTVKFLARFGFSEMRIQKVYDHFGENTVEKISENPYQLIQVRGISFSETDRIGRALGKGLDSYERISGCVLAVLQDLCTQDTYASLEVVTADSMGQLNSGIVNDEGKTVYPVSQQRFGEALQAMAKNRLIKAVDNRYIFLRAMNAAENDVAVRLTALLKNPIPEEDVQKLKDALASFMQTSKVPYSARQQAAILKCVSSRVAVLTGGPGTGKTTVVTGIIAVYKAVFGDDVILMAPTGKAARRMEESTHLPASTIHSRLQLRGEDAEVEEPEQITKGYIIIDESSMIDQTLMQSLIHSMASDDLHVLFVGDINQLPSVGAGAVLHELIASNVIPVARLTEVFRQKGGGGTIVDNANRINSGVTDLAYDDSFRFMQAGSEEEAVRLIKRLYASEVKEWGIDNVALLTPRRAPGDNWKYKCAADALNLELQAMVNPPSGDPEKSAMICGKTWRVNDRVMQWKNTKDSSNGDIGVIQEFMIDKDGIQRVKIKWENGNETLVSATDMRNISLAYALSIHKSQGSEYQSVIIPILTSEQCAMFQRNLLYTGVTRAKKRVILVGDKPALARCIVTASTNERKSMLARRLQVHANGVGS